MSTIKCTKCSNLIPNESAFCPFCGNKIDPPKTEKPCSKCNESVPLDSKFCPFCGSKVKSSIDQTTEKTDITAQKSNFRNNQNNTHYDFKNINQNHPKKLKHFKIPTNEQVLIIGDIRPRNFSIYFWIVTLIYYIVCFVLIKGSYIVKAPPSSSSISSISRFRENSIYLLGLQIGSERRWDGAVNYYSTELILVVLICILLVLIPFVIYHIIIKFNVLRCELALTNNNIYLYSLAEEPRYTIIDITRIKNIDCKPCPWFWGANKIKITLTSGSTYSISGLSNAHEFIKESIKATKNKMHT